MDHRTFLAEMDPGERALLTQRADGPGLRHLALHGGLILVLGVLIATGIPFWWLLLLPQGLLLAFLFTLQHETTHQTPFASERLNEWVGAAAGLLIVQPFQWFRYFHFAHHRHTNDPENDPELGEGKPEGWVAFALYLSTLAYWRDKLSRLWLNAAGRMDDDFIPQRSRKRVRREARWMIAIYAAVLAFTLTVSDVFLWAWLVPLALGFPFLRIYLLAEHGRCPFVADMFDNTRTTYTNRAVRFLAWNMPYHAEHHVFPQVPFHQLPQLHEKTRDYLRQTEDGYTTFARHYVAEFE